MKKYYRVCCGDNLHGLWYTTDGEFTGHIHDKFNFCTNSKLEMEFDETIVGWLSAVDRLDDLWAWFTREDVLELEKHGYFIHEFEAEEEFFYERFQHLVIKAETARVIRMIKLEELSHVFNDID